MRRAWIFGIISLFVLVSCRMTNEPTEAPTRGILPLPTQEVPEKGTPPEEKNPGTFSKNRLMEFDIPSGRALGQKGVELWYNSDGEVWSRGEFFDVGQNKAVLFAQRDGRYEVVFVPIDPKGTPGYIPARDTRPDYIVTVDTRSPQVEVRCPNGGESFQAGKTTLIEWHAVDSDVRSDGIRVEVKKHDGQWVTIHENLPNTGSLPWDIPRFEGGREAVRQYKVRVSATDRAGNTGSDESDKSFSVDGLSPEAHVVGPSVSNSNPVEVSYVVEDFGGTGVRTVHLWFTRDSGASWDYYGSDDDATSPILFQGLDGDYGFYTTAVDHVGNKAPDPQGGKTKPQHRTIVDSSSPRMKFIAPKKQAYLAGRAIEVRWALRDNVGLSENPVRLDVSSDGGKSWKLIREKISKDSPFLWSPPKVSGDQYMFRATVHDLAGNETITRSGLFAIDTALPEARITGPAQSLESISKIEYEIINQGFSPIGSVVLWYSSDNGAHWHRWGEDPDLMSPMTFAKDDGKYALYLTCESVAGARTERRQKPPVQGARPDFTFDIEIDSIPPIMEIQDVPDRTVYAAGGEYLIRWTEGTPKEIHPSSTGVDLFYSTNGGKTWEKIAENLDPAEGRYVWTLPAKMNEKSVLVRLEGEDSFGNRGSSETEIPFEVDGVAPGVSGKFSVDDDVRNLPKTVTVTYRSSDAQSGLKNVSLWGKRKDGVEFVRLEENASPRGTISVDISEKGEWDFWLIAEDMSGNLSLDLKKEPLPAFSHKIGFPKTVELELLTFAGGGKPYRGGASLLIALRTNIPLSDLHAKISSDSGKTWTTIPDQNVEPVRGGLLWHNMPVTTGEHYRLMLFNRYKEAISKGDFSIDGTPPTASVVGPSTKVKKSAVVLDTKLAPSLSLIVSRTLWVTSDGGKRWSLYQVFRDPKVEVIFSAPKPGKYGFYLVATSRVGLSGKNPVSGMAPQFSIHMGEKTPSPIADPSGKLILTTTPSSILKGGSVESISWKGASNDPKASVTLYLHCDGSNTVIKEGLPVSGEYDWTVPTQSTYRCNIRAAIIIGGVPQWAKATAGFSIDIAPPRVTGSEIVEE